MLAMYTHSGLKPLDKMFLGYLVFAPKPGTSRLKGVTISGLAEDLHLPWHSLRETIDRLSEGGFIDCDFRRGHEGWIELLSYDETFARIGWFHAQIAKAQVASRIPTKRFAESDEANRENAERTLDLCLSGEDSTASPTVEPVVGLGGSNEGTQVAGPLSSSARLGYEREQRGMSRGDFEQLSADDEIVEIRDFDVDDWANEIEAFESVDAGFDHLEEPTEGLGADTYVSTDDHAYALLTAAFGELTDIEAVA
jgi:hypothetical protein